MIYLLLGLLFVFFLCSYKLIGKDFFEPATMLYIVFILSTVCSIYKWEQWKYYLNMHTVFLIISALGISLLINLLVYYRYCKVKSNISSEKITPISNRVSIVILLLIVMACFIMLENVQRIGGDNEDFFSMMLSFRTKNAYGTNLENQLPAWVRQVLNLSTSISYIFLFNIIYFWKSLDRYKKIINFLILFMCMTTSLLTGGRFSSLCLVITGITMFYLIQIRSGKRYNNFQMKTIIKIILLVVVVLYAFYLAKEFVGRVSEEGPIDYIAHYAGGAIPGLNLYLDNPPEASEIIGKETFYSLINGLRKLRILDIPYYYVHHEFRSSGGVSIGNTYTAFRDYHYDFGWIGVYVLHSIFALVFSIFYQQIKKRGKNIDIILFSMIYYCVVFYGISNHFFSNVISFGFVIKIFWIVLLYTLLLKKKVRFKIR